MTITSTSIPQNSQWDEGGCYLYWSALEEIRDTMVDYIQVLTSNPGLYDSHTINKVRLQMQALGARNEYTDNGS